MLKLGGCIHIKTDSDLLFEFTQEEITEKGYILEEWIPNLYGNMSHTFDEKTRSILHIKTHYERLFAAKGSTIKYGRFRLG
jgi:tRNA (guanine-N7-)-methyltransferase